MKRRKESISPRKLSRQSATDPFKHIYVRLWQLADEASYGRKAGWFILVTPDDELEFPGGPWRTEAEALKYAKRKGWVVLNEPGQTALFSNPKDDGELWVDTWEERDRLAIHLYYGRRGDASASREIAEWWDDDARGMFDDGFFKSGRKLEESVIEYARDMRLTDLYGRPPQ